MKFIYKDLLHFLSEKPSIKNLSERLFQLGHEHEINGEVFDVEFTPNRGDCLSLIGLSRDLNVFFEKAQPYKIFQGDIGELNLDFKNLSPEICPKISFLEIEIEDNINEYKPYLESYFSLLGNKKVNFFTDVSNYVSYELGQPTHCFDANTISDELTFENRICEEPFHTLLGSDINLTGMNCIFSVNNEIVSLAGVMGGMSTACSTSTKKALIECAYFIPEAITGKSVKYNLASDAAHKFERGVDIQSQEEVLRRFIEIVRDHVPIKNIKIQIFDEGQAQKVNIPIDVTRINKILGTDLDEEKYLIYLSKLGFDIEKEIVVPTYRHDIASQNDLAEEIARVIGYNNIISKPLKITKKLDKNIDDINRLKNYLIKNGFSEVINFPFTANEEKKSISIDNPLDSNRNNLRTSLKNSLLDNLLYNERRQKDSIKLFEISDLYTKSDQINQEKKLGIIISGRQGHNYIDFSKKLDHAYLNNLLNQDYDNSVFTIEEISRTGLKTKKKDRIFYIEISIHKIPKVPFKVSKSSINKINFIKYQSVSEFPSSTRDFSFSITDFKKYDTVINYLSDLNDTNLKDAFIFDFYENKKLNEIKVGIRFIFQSNFNTLSEDEIQKSVNKLLNPIIDLEGVSIPGL
ncbi:MAG: phenylalanine--tRNA ligase subunit beta [Gammaproteobacteria bacterium]